MVSIESIKEFNNRLQQQQAIVQRVQTQLEMKKKDLDNKLAALSASTGRALNESNINDYYNEVVAGLEKQLTNGCAILDKVEGKTVDTVVTPGVEYQSTPQNSGVYSAPVSAPVNTPVGQPIAYGTPVAAPYTPGVNGPVTAQTMAPPVQQAVTPPVSVAAPPVVNPAPTVNEQGVPVYNVGNMDAQVGVDMNSFGIIRT